jgi:hypothetical protein
MDHLPKDFLHAPVSTQCKIVALGLNAWLLVQDELDAQKDLDQSSLIEIWKEKGRKEARNQNEKEHQKSLRNLESERDEILFEKTILEKKLTKIEKEAEERLVKSEKELSDKLRREFEREKEHILREARLALKEEMGSIKDENVKLKAAQDFKSAFEFVQKKYDDQILANQELKDKIQELTRVRSSYHLGKEGEGEIENFLKQTPDFDFINVNMEADKADFRLTTKDKKVIILDSKKFSYVVGKKDRDKLVDNTDRDATVCAGIMISLNSKIAARQHCEIEITPGSKPILYLCLMNMTQEAKFHCLDISLKLLMRLVNSQNEKERSELIDKIHNAFVMLEELKKKMENSKKAATELLENLKVSLTDVKRITDVLVI